MTTEKALSPVVRVGLDLWRGKGPRTHRFAPAGSHTTRAAPANGIESTGARRTGAEGFGAWIICPLPT